MTYVLLFLVITKKKELWYAILLLTFDDDPLPIVPWRVLHQGAIYANGRNYQE